LRTDGHGYNRRKEGGERKKNKEGKPGTTLERKQKKE
jgi:hypothetical protein